MTKTSICLILRTGTVLANSNSLVTVTIEKRLSGVLGKKFLSSITVELVSGNAADLQTYTMLMTDRSKDFELEFSRGLSL